MKKFLKVFFSILGVLFFILILAVVVFFVFDPLGLRSLPNSNITVQSVIKTTVNKDAVEVDNVDKNPLMNEQQEAILESLGVDPTDLPTEITPTMEECFAAKLGAERVAEITAGDSPTVLEFLQVSDCY